MRHEAKLWETADGAVICRVCPRRCRIPEGGYGFCGTRKLTGRVLYAENYGRITAAAVDPIEKKTAVSLPSGNKDIFRKQLWL